MIPEAAVEAAKSAYLNEFNYDENAEYIARLILEAAAPHMLSHERQQTADAHRDAIVNARTVDKLNKAIAGVEALCREEDARQTSKAYAAVDDIRATIIKALQ